MCLAAVTSIIDWRRCHRPELAPMESICLQINTIEPNSQHRIEAIQKVGFKNIENCFVKLLLGNFDV